MVCALRLQTETTQHQVHALGIVDAHEGEQSLRVRFLISRGARPEDPEDPEDPADARLKRVAGLMTSNSYWFLTPCANLATVQREWAAVQRVGQLPFLSTLLHATVRSQC